MRMWQRAEFRRPDGPTATVAFTGDLLLDYPPGRITTVQPALRERLRQCDVVVVNQEGPLTTAPPNKIEGGTVHSAHTIH